MNRIHGARAMDKKLKSKNLISPLRKKPIPQRKVDRHGEFANLRKRLSYL